MFRQACTAALCALALLGISARASGGHAPPQIPYGLQLGTTHIEDAQAQWAAAGAQVLNSGSAIAGAGMTKAGQPILDPHILVVDIANTGFEGMDDRPTHFEFLDGVLFGFHVTLSTLTNDLPKDKQMGKEQVEALRQRLVQEYGPPTRSGSGFPGAKKPDIFIWQFGASQLQLDNGLLGASLSYANPALSKQAEATLRKIRTHPQAYQ